jgi:hypothetical protein
MSSSCEKCWSDAGGDPHLYTVLLEDRRRVPCSPEEQAGPHAYKCLACGRMVLHQHTREHMGRCSGRNNPERINDSHMDL